jgi:hypothetical protein
LSMEYDRPSRLKGYVDLSHELGAQYLLIDFQIDPQVFNQLQIEPVYSNTTYTLLKLNPALNFGE